MSCICQTHKRHVGLSGVPTLWSLDVSLVRIGTLLFSISLNQVLLRSILQCLAPTELVSPFAMSSGLVADIFDVARKEFLLKFKNTPNYDFSKLSSIDDVYNATDEIQKKQTAQRALRNLRKIQPFLDGLSKYEKVIETFVQAKPDVLALIWVNPPPVACRIFVLTYQGANSIHLGGTYNALLRNMMLQILIVFFLGCSISPEDLR